MTNTLSTMDSSLRPSRSDKAWYTCRETKHFFLKENSVQHGALKNACTYSTEMYTATLYYSMCRVYIKHNSYSGSLLYDITDINYPEVLKEVEECLIEVLIAMLTWRGSNQLSKRHQHHNYYTYYMYNKSKTYLW